MTLWWGEPWPRPDFRASVCADDAQRVEVPVGEPCARCGLAVGGGDQGVSLAHLGEDGQLGRSHFTIECFLREVVPEPLVSEVIDQMRKDPGPDGLGVWA